MNASTFHDELLRPKRLNSRLPDLGVLEPSDLADWSLIDARLRVHSGTLGVLLGDGDFRGYDAVLMVCNGVSNVQWGDRPHDRWRQWTVESVDSRVTGGAIEVEIVPMLMTQSS